MIKLPGSQYIDPRSALAQQLMTQGTSTAPVSSPWQGLARIGQAIAGNYMQGQIAKDKEDANRALVKGLTAKPWQVPQGELVTDEEGYELPPEVHQRNAQKAGGLSGAVSALQGLQSNPHAADLAKQFAIQDILRKMNQQEQEAAAARQFSYQRDLKASPGWVAPKAPKPGVDVPLPQDVLKQKIELAQSGRPVNVGSIPAGFRLEGEKLVPIPGGPADKKEGIEKKETQARITSIDQNIKLVEELINHPGMSDVVGVPGSASGVVRQLLGRPLPATDAAGFDARLKQIQGKQFLEAFQNLKGGGQITEAEGAKATDAMSRLGQTNVRESEYKKAAQELVDILKAARSRVKGGDKVDPDNSTAVDDLLKKYIK